MNPPPRGANPSSHLSVPRRAAPVFAILVASLLAGCATPSASSPRSTPSPSASQLPQPTASASAVVTPAPSGFAFDTAAVLDYYRGQGFDCSDPQPSSSAADHTFQGCQVVDTDGRTLVIGLTTDAAGDLADAFASVQGRAGETILAPTDALDHLSGFLGAMLGTERGLSLLAWLAGHLGDAYAQTVSVDLVVATYTGSETDHSRLYLEIANQAYIDAPSPSPSAS